MRKVLLTLAVVASVAVGSVSPAKAVTGNFTVDTVHNYVGLIAFYDADGNFKIEDLPAGEYEVEVWHEVLGKSPQKVTIQGGQDTKVAWEMKKG